MPPPLALLLGVLTLAKYSKDFLFKAFQNNAPALTYSV